MIIANIDEIYGIRAVFRTQGVKRGLKISVSDGLKRGQLKTAQGVESLPKGEKKGRRRKLGGLSALDKLWQSVHLSITSFRTLTYGAASATAAVRR